MDRPPRDLAGTPTEPLWSIIEGQATLSINVTKRRVRVTTVVVVKQYAFYTYTECVSVA